MLKRIILILVVLACAAGGIWWLYDGKRQPSDLLTLYGNVDIRQVDVGFRVGGRVTELFKEEGNAVKTGERLARLDAKPYEEVFDQAAAQLSMQEIELRKMVAGYRTEDIEQARATLNGAQAVYANAASNLRRVERLRQQNAVSQQSLDEARASYGDALSRRNAAREQLQLMESGYRSEDVERQKAAVEAARAELARATTNLQDTELFAPQDGVVLTRVHEIGAVVQGGQTVYTVTLNNPVWIRAYVTQPNLGNIRPGQEVLLSIDATPDKTYRGRIGFISPTAEFTPKTVETKEVRNDLVFRFRVIADDPDNVMRQGMPVTVTLRKDGGKPWVRRRSCACWPGCSCRRPAAWKCSGASPAPRHRTKPFTMSGICRSVSGCMKICPSSTISISMPNCAGLKARRVRPCSKSC